MVAQKTKTGNMRLMYEVWERAHVRCGSRSMLAMIAFYADPRTRTAELTIEQMRRHCWTSRQTIKNRLAECVRAGDLEIIVRPGKTNLYHLTPR